MSKSSKRGYIPLDKHHRLPRSRGGDNSKRNIVMVPQKLHRAWHTLVGNMTAPEVAELLSNVWIDPDYILIAMKRDDLEK